MWCYRIWIGVICNPGGCIVVFFFMVIAFKTIQWSLHIITTQQSSIVNLITSPIILLLIVVIVVDIIGTIVCDHKIAD
jgi:hypothetical protein